MPFPNLDFKYIEYFYTMTSILMIVVKVVLGWRDGSVVIRAHAVLPADLGSILSTLMAAHNFV